MVAKIHSNWNLILLELNRWKQLFRIEHLVSYSTASHSNPLLLGSFSASAEMYLTVRP